MISHELMMEHLEMDQWNDWRSAAVEMLHRMLAPGLLRFERNKAYIILAHEYELLIAVSVRDAVYPFMAITTLLDPGSINNASAFIG